MNQNKNIVIKNIYYMLSYAFHNVNKDVYENVDKEDFDNVLDMFASILVKSVSFHLKQGLYKEYVDKEEDLTTIRGKIDIQQSIKNKIIRKSSLVCRFDELSENNLLNRIIKSTSFLIIRSKDVNREYKDALRKQMIFFENVDCIDFNCIRYNGIKYHQNNLSYRFTISICQLIIEGMLLTNSKGQYKLATIIDDQHMHKLYEKFILEYYKKHYPNLYVNSKWLDWAYDEESLKGLPKMLTDIYIKKDNKVLIIDAKYYGKNLLRKNNSLVLHSANLYQIFTYVKNEEYELIRKGKDYEVAGMLLYAKTEDEIQPNVSCIVAGNKISAKSLDLNLDFKEITKQLNKIINDYFA